MTRAFPPARHASRDSQAVRTVLHAAGAPMALAAAAGAAGSGSTHLVARGETLSGIAVTHGTSVSALVRANHLRDANRIFAGERLRIPAGATTATTRRVVRTVVVRHRVVPGDNLIRIGRRYDVAPRVIARANHLRDPRIVVLGTILDVPVRRTITVRTGGTSRPSSANSFAGRTYPDATVAAAARDRARLARTRQPSREQTRRLIVATARRYGVDPELALAISWQESGWNQRRVSIAHAIGAMQVMPATGTWMSGVAGRPLDLLDARDNVTAGVLLLRVLDRATTKATDVIAGYYQGLGNVRRHGYFADTVHYIANVQALTARFERG